MSYRDLITIEPDKRGGKPCIRRMRITVYDVLGWLAAGMSHAEILEDFPELTEEDIRASLEFAADREHRLVAAVGAVFTWLPSPPTESGIKRYSPSLSVLLAGVGVAADD